MEDEAFVQAQVDHSRRRRAVRQVAAQVPKGSRILGEMTADELSAVITGAVFKAAVALWLIGLLLVILAMVLK